MNSFSVGPFLNAGARSSEIYDKSDFYSTSGLVLEYKTRLQNDKSEDDWIFKLSGNYYYIISDIDAITSDDYGGIIKASADRKIYKTLFVGLNYKYGNDNPGYQYIQTLELSMKYKY